MTTLFVAFVVAGQLFFGQGQFNSFAACEKAREAMVDAPEYSAVLRPVADQVDGPMRVVRSACITNI